MTTSGPVSHAPVAALNRSLDLKYVGDSTYVGRYQGYPLGITYTVDAEYLNADGQPVYSIQALVQLRYVGAPEDFALDGQDIEDIPESPLRDMIADRSARISLEENIAWLTITDATAEALEAGLQSWLDTTVGIIESIGGRHNREICHYCNARRAIELNWVEARVAQVCDACLNAKLEEARLEGRATAKGVAKLFVWAPTACLVGAALWVALWQLDQWILSFFVSRPGKSISVPDIVIFAQIAIFAGTFGGATGWVVGRAKGAGKVPAAIAGALAGLVAAFAGTLAQIWWFVYSEFGLYADFANCLRLFPEFFFSNSRAEGDVDGMLHFGTTLGGTIVASCVAGALAGGREALEA